MTFALSVAGVGVVIALGTWIGVCLADARDQEREDLATAQGFLDELAAETHRW